MKSKLLIGILLIVVAAPFASAQTQTPCVPPPTGSVPCISAHPELPDITSGQQVTIYGDNLPVKEVPVKVRLTTGKADSKLLRDATVDTSRKSLTFVASDVPHENYLVFVIIGDKELPVPGHLRVLADSALQVKLTTAHPLTQYPSTLHSGYDLLLVGENFARHADDNLIEVVGRGYETPIYSSDCLSDPKFLAQSPGPSQKPQPCLQSVHEPGLETRELKFFGFQPDKYSGPVKLRVRIKGSDTNVSDPVTATMSRISATAALLLALVVFFLLSWIVIRLVSKDVKEYRIGGKGYGAITGFFLDKETNSFSLSKFQLLAWTAVSIYGYVYLFVCRMLIQWDFSFPPIPDNLPQLLAISAGTTVAATGITSNIGSKGAGDVAPSVSDFISTGGLVVGERFQFFVWTLMGCLGFLSLLLLKDPSTISELPKVPDTFLYLMGVSSVGYLGGKVVRKPGPVIKLAAVTAVVPFGGNMPSSITPAPPAPPPAPTTGAPGKVMVINLKGENLDASAGAKLQVDNRPFDRADDFWIRGTADDQTHFCTEVYVGIIDAEAKGYLEGDHVLTLINTDGQAASIHFPVDALQIDSFTVEHPKDQPAVLKVIGKNFVKQNMQVKWQPAKPGALAVGPVDLTADQVGSATELNIPLANIQNFTGDGKLIVISTPFSLSAGKDGTIPAA